MFLVAGWIPHPSQQTLSLLETPAPPQGTHQVQSVRFPKALKSICSSHSCGYHPGHHHLSPGLSVSLLSVLLAAGWTLKLQAHRFPPLLEICFLVPTLCRCYFPGVSSQLQPPGPPPLMTVVPHGRTEHLFSAPKPVLLEWTIFPRMPLSKAVSTKGAGSAFPWFPRA